MVATLFPLLPSRYQVSSHEKMGGNWKKGLQRQENRDTGKKIE